MIKSGVSQAVGMLLLVALLAGAWRDGLYFDADYYGFAASLQLSAACLLVFSIATGSVSPWGGRSCPRLQRSIPPWEGLLAGWPFLLSIAYLLHLAQEPVSMQYTISEALRWASSGAWLLLTCYAVSWRGGRLGLLLALQLTGGAIVWTGLGSWLGWLHLPKALLGSGNAQISALGYRLAGLFQYPNMLAVVLGSFFIWYLLQLVRPLPSGWHGNRRLPARLQVLLPALLLAPTQAALLLTESRGAWLITALGWLCALLVLRGGERAALLRSSACSLLCAVLLCRVLVQQGPALQGHAAPPTVSALVVALTLGGAALLLALRQPLRQQPRNGRRVLASSAWSWGALAAAVGSALWLLPQALGGRLGSGQYETAGARRLLYEDALRLWRESPWLGFGGGAWRVQFERIQQQPYVGSRVHSAYLDILLDLGAVGLALLAVALLLSLIAVSRRSAFIWTLPPLVLLAHGAIDLDNAFGFYWMLLLTYLALYIVPQEAVGSSGQAQSRVDNTLIVEQRPIDVGDPVCLPPTPTCPSRERKRSEREAWDSGSGVASAVDEEAGVYRPGRWRRLAKRTGLAVLALGLLLGAGIALRLHLAQAAYEEASRLPLSQRQEWLERSLRLNPYEQQSRLALAPLLAPSARLELLEDGLRYSPQSSDLLWELGLGHAESGAWEQAAHYMELALQRDRYNKERQTRAVIEMEKLARQLAMEEKQQESGYAASAALALYARYEQLARELAERSHTANDRRFELTLLAQQYAEYSRGLLQGAK